MVSESNHPGNFSFAYAATGSSTETCCYFTGDCLGIGRSGPLLTYENFSQISSAHSVLRRLQIAGPLSRLLVLEAAWPAHTLSPPAQAAHRARLCPALSSARAGGNRHLLWRDGGCHEKSLCGNLFRGIRFRAGPAGG